MKKRTWVTHIPSVLRSQDREGTAFSLSVTAPGLTGFIRYGGPFKTPHAARTGADAVLRALRRKSPALRIVQGSLYRVQKGKAGRGVGFWNHTTGRWEMYDLTLE